MSRFNTTGLSGDRVLVTGTDEQAQPRQVILDATEFNQYWTNDLTKKAAADFDAAVEAFFAPLMDAADKVEAATKKMHDPAFYVVVQESSPGSEEKHEILHKLGKDTVVLRMLHEGNTARLLWVGDSIEVLALPDQAPAFAVPFASPTQTDPGPTDGDAYDVNVVRDVNIVNVDRD